MSQGTVLDGETVTKSLAAFLGRQTGSEVAISGLRRYTVGFSWITYGFDAAWHDSTGARHEKLILRLGPPTGLFAPYRAFPQFASLKALEGSAVPVPRVYWYGEELDTFGAPFFICEKVEGEAPLPSPSQLTVAIRMKATTSATAQARMSIAPSLTRTTRRFTVSAT